MTATLTQNQALLAYLQRWGEVTPLEAWRELGIYRLAARIKELRAQHDIRTEHTSSGATKYRLVRPRGDMSEQQAMGFAR